MVSRVPDKHRAPQSTHAQAPAAPRPPDADTLKVALLAAAAASPAVERQVLGTSPAPDARLPGSAFEASRAVRAQTIAYELNANNGRYCSRADGVAINNQRELAPHPLVWAAIPVHGRGDARFFAAVDDEEGARLQQQIFREVTIPGRAEPLRVALLPLQWEEAKTLRRRFPDLVLIEDGQVYRGSSPRSLFVGTKPGEQPSLVTGLEGYSLKMHLSAETYTRLGGLGGNRDINFNDALFAAVLSHAFIEATRDIPIIEVQSESRAVAAKIGGEGGIEVGAIFRKLQRGLAVPGFAFFSPTTERLPGDTSADSVRVRSADPPRVLAADAIREAQRKNPGLSKADAFVKLFVDPLLDVNFQLAARGWSMELHPQNFLLQLDERTGLTNKVVIRDLHGLGYSATHRKHHGLVDQMSVESLRETFPQITQADIDGYFKRDGKLRDRFKTPAMFQNSIDFFTSIFWYQLLGACQNDVVFSKDEVTTLVERIKDRVAAKADEHGFDLKTLAQPPKQTDGTTHDYWNADKHGIRQRIVFRRAA